MPTFHNLEHNAESGDYCRRYEGKYKIVIRIQVYKYKYKS